MRKLIDYGLVVLAIAAIGTGVEWYREREREKTAESYVKSLAKAVETRRVGEPPAVALATEAAAAADEEVRALRDNNLRFERAGVAFLSFYILTAEILPEVCGQYGVTLDRFVATYAAIHKEPLIEARRRTSATPTSESTLRSRYMSRWRANTADALRQTAQHDKSDPKTVCMEIELNGAENAAKQNLAAFLPHVYSVLYEKTAR